MYRGDGRVPDGVSNDPPVSTVTKGQHNAAGELLPNYDRGFSPCVFDDSHAAAQVSVSSPSSRSVM
jgi:hypothetical protein